MNILNFILYSAPSTEYPDGWEPYEEVSEPTTQLGRFFHWVYDTMVSLEVSYNGFTFNMWDVFVTVIILSLLGYMLGKFLNPWGHEHDE